MTDKYQTSPTHNIVFTIPRTASHLLTKLLNLPAQSTILRHPQDGYFFLPALRIRYQHETWRRPVDEWADKEIKDMNESLQQSFQAWAQWVDQAEKEGKGTFIKEHINWMINLDTESAFIHSTHGKHNSSDAEPFNPTCIPATFLLAKARPTFLIRHPALTFPSLFRTTIENEGRDSLLTPLAEKIESWEATYHWHVQLYRYFITQEPSQYHPVILDASDLHLPALVKQYASAVGLDPALVRFEWDAASPAEQQALSGMEKRMKDTILNSAGVDSKRLLGGQSGLDKERLGWAEEFGEVLAGRLKDAVGRAMEGYEWLWERRMRV